MGQVESTAGWRAPSRALRSLVSVLRLGTHPVPLMIMFYWDSVCHQRQTWGRPMNESSLIRLLIEIPCPGADIVLGTLRNLWFFMRMQRKWIWRHAQKVSAIWLETEKKMGAT